MSLEQKIQEALDNKIRSGNYYKGTLGESGTGVGALYTPNLMGVSADVRINAEPRVNYINKFKDHLKVELITTFFPTGDYSYDLEIGGEYQDILWLETDAISDLTSINNWVGKIAQHPKVSRLLSTLATLGFKDFVISTPDKSSIYTYILFQG